MLVFRLRTTVQRGGTIEIPSQWTEQGRRVAVAVQDREGARGEGAVFRRELSKSDRTSRAVKSLALCLCLALVSAVVPPHLPWPPFFTLVGVIVFFVRVKQETLLLGGVVTCPGCAHSSKLDPQSEDWPLLLVCGSCNLRLNIVQASEDAA